MHWAQIIITTSHTASEAIANFLFDMDVLGVEFKDVNESTTSLISYYPLDDLVNTRVRRISNFLSELSTWGLDPQPAKIELKHVESEEWLEAWKSTISPQRIGKHLLVVPTWYEIPFDEKSTIIRLDPGMAFGTGHHPTTRLSLQLLEQVVEPSQYIADIGTGSGILAIAAIKLGAEHVDAIELDPTAIPVACENFEINDVIDHISLIQGDGIKTLNGKYDLIVGNILTKTILPIILHCPSRLLPEGHVIFSGILESEMPQVQEVLSDNGLECVQMLQETEGDLVWTAVLARILI